MKYVYAGGLDLRFLSRAVARSVLEVPWGTGYTCGNIEGGLLLRIGGISVAKGVPGMMGESVVHSWNACASGTSRANAKEHARK